MDTDEDLVCTECCHVQPDGEYCEICGASVNQPTRSSPGTPLCPQCGEPQGDGAYCRECGIQLGSPRGVAYRLGKVWGRERAGQALSLAAVRKRHRFVAVGVLVCVIVAAVVIPTILAKSGNGNGASKEDQQWKEQADSYVSQVITLLGDIENIISDNMSMSDMETMRVATEGIRSLKRETSLYFACPLDERGDSFNGYLTHAANFAELAYQAALTYSSDDALWAQIKSEGLSAADALQRYRAAMGESTETNNSIALSVPNASIPVTTQPQPLTVDEQLYVTRVTNIQAAGQRASQEIEVSADARNAMLRVNAELLSLECPSPRFAEFYALYTQGLRHYQTYLQRRNQGYPSSDEVTRSELVQGNKDSADALALLQPLTQLP